MATVSPHDRLGSALLITVAWLEYIWNRDTEEAEVAVLDVDIDRGTVSLYSNDQNETNKFKDYLLQMMDSIDPEIQDGYGGKI